MSTMITELYDAFIDAGASEEKSRAAADYDSRFNKIDQDMALLKAEVVVLKWMLSFLVAGMVTLLFKAFTA